MAYRRGATTTYFDHGWMGEIEPRGGGRRQKLARPNKWSHSTGPEFIIARGEIVVVPRLWPWNFSDDSDTRDIVNLSSKVKFLATRKSVDSDLFHGNENINNVIFLEDKERDVKKKFVSLFYDVFIEIILRVRIITFIRLYS